MSTRATYGVTSSLKVSRQRTHNFWIKWSQQLLRCSCNPCNHEPDQPVAQNGEPFNPSDTHLLSHLARIISFSLLPLHASSTAGPALGSAPLPPAPTPQGLPTPLRSEGLLQREEAVQIVNDRKAKEGIQVPPKVAKEKSQEAPDLGKHRNVQLDRCETDR